jgi:hypothetical protein
MRYVTHISHQMQKHKFSVTCPGAPFVESAPGPPEHEKYSVDILKSGRTGMHYIARISHRMREHKFRLTCPGALFVVSALSPP